MSTTRPIILVGHCGPDRFLLKSAIARAVPGARILDAKNAEELEPLLAEHPLVLINRVLEDGFATDSGIELIRQLRARPNPPATMLVSNREDAQAEAIAAGAWPGFGKSRLLGESTMTRLRNAATISPETTPVAVRSPARS